MTRIRAGDAYGYMVCAFYYEDGTCVVGFDYLDDVPLYEKMEEFVSSGRRMEILEVHPYAPADSFIEYQERVAHWREALLTLGVPDVF